jgi:membrane protease YdiL (CAAX protease family)
MGVAGPFAASFLLFLVPGLMAQRAHPAAGLAWTEIFAFLVPAAAAAAGSNLRPVPFLRLSRPPTAAQALLALLLGVAAFVVAGALHGLLSALFPEAWVRAFDVTRLFDGPPWRRLTLSILAAFLAPLCEEAAFRGYVQGALLTRSTPGRAIALSSLLFAAMHLDPVRFLPVLGLGILYGWITWRSGSLWPAVAAHVANNGIASLLALASSGAAPEPIDPRWAAAAAALGGAAVALLASVYRRATPRPPPPEESLVLRDPDDPSIGFRWNRLPPAFGLLAVLGLGGLLGIALFARSGLP